MTYKQIAMLLYPDAETIDGNRRVFESKEEGVIFSLIKSKYNFKDNIDSAVLIDNDIAYMVDESKLEKIDKKLKKLGISLPEIININISKKHLSEYQYLNTFKIPILNKLGVTVEYNNRGIFITKANIKKERR